MNEIQLTAQGDRTVFGRIVQALDGAGAKIVSTNDYQQLLSPTDQMYIDYTWHGKLFTLHFEHSLGIFLLSDVLDVTSLNEIARQLVSVS